MFFIHIVNALGSTALSLCYRLGKIAIFFGRTLYALFTTRLKGYKTLGQINRIGVDSLSIVALTSLFTGMVVALYGYISTQRIGGSGQEYIGASVALSMIRGLGPVLTGIMVAGRAGSAIAAELGTMRITEQIDALKTLGINVYAYLIVPHFIAGIIALPLLTLFSMLCGIAGGYLFCVPIAGLNPESFLRSIRETIVLGNIIDGLIKAAMFGLVITWIGTYKGYRTSGGARGVGRATTQTVVSSSILILILNYFLTKLLENI